MDFQGTVPPGISPNNQSPILKASDETNQMPPLEEVYADRNINNRLKDMEEVVRKLLSKNSMLTKESQRRRDGQETLPEEFMETTMPLTPDLPSRVVQIPAGVTLQTLALLLLRHPIRMRQMRLVLLKGDRNISQRRKESQRRRESQLCMER